MLVKRFLAWIQSAPAEARAGATAALARTWLGSDLNAFEKVDAAAALTLMLDDPDIVVRQALAEVFADCDDAPRHVVFALAGDVPEIALPVLRNSPLLEDTDLVEWVATRGVAVQAAIAARQALSAPVAAALAEVAEPEAVAILVGNPEARIPAFSLARMAERFSADPGIADALLERADLEPMARFCILAARHHRHDETGREGPPGDAREKAAITVAATLGEEELVSFVRALRQRAMLNASLLLRALAMGEVGFFEAVLAELSRLPVRRVAAIAAERRGAGFPALCRKVGLPVAIVPVLRAALAVAAEVSDGGAGEVVGLRPPSWILARIMDSEPVRGLDAGHPLAGFLRRMAADIARDEGRRLALALAPPRLSDEPLQLDASMMVGPALSGLLQDNRPLSTEADAFAGAMAPMLEAPSFGAMAALLEDTVAAALANLPPPQPPREDRDASRRAVVIEGEWVGVAVDQGFDPDQFGVAAAA